MKKRIFEEQSEPEELLLQAKREFDPNLIVAEDDENPIEQSITSPKNRSRFGIRLLLFCFGLFTVAVVAQSVQWLWESWQAKQWIYLAFALAFFGLSVTGVGVILSEWRKLVWLRHYHQQQQSTVTQLQTSGQEMREFCQKQIRHLPPNRLVQQGEARWLSQLDDSHNAEEVMYLFSQNVLTPLDNQVKKLISQSALENALIVAVSPLAIVDILMMAWRNIALVNKITRTYGMELGYLSRLKLFRLVLTNMVFAGATEMATDLGSEFFTQNLTAKFSMRAAQGIGAGLLTARLGIKAMEFCRPIMFQKNERPTLSVVRQTLIGAFTAQFFSKSKESEKEMV